MAIIATIILVIAVAVSVTAMLQDTTNTTQQTDEQSASQETENLADDTAVEDAALTITFTDDGFDEDRYTVSAGETVAVVNQSSSSMEFSSDDHPTHRENSEINLPVVGSGETITFVPETPGEFGVHDHIRAQFTTTLVVQ